MAIEARENMVRSAEASSMATAHRNTIFRLSARDKDEEEEEEEEEEASGSGTRTDGEAALLHVTERRRRL